MSPYSCLYLIAALFADSSFELHASPQLVTLFEEAGHHLLPVLAQRPWIYLVFILIIILLHGVGKIPTEGTNTPHFNMTQDTNVHVSFFQHETRYKRSRFLLSNLQCNEEIHGGVFSNGKTGPFEVHEGHGQKVLKQRGEDS